MHKVYGKLVHIGLAVVILLNAATNGVAQGKIWEVPLRGCWSFPSSEMSREEIASDNEQKILLPQFPNKIISLSSHTGAVIWKAETSGKTLDFLSTSSKTLSLLTTPRNESKENGDKQKNVSLFRNVDLKSGIFGSSFEVSGSSEMKFIDNSSQSTKFVYGKSGFVAAYPSKSKRPLWQTHLETGISAVPLIFDNRIALGTDNKTLVLLSKTDGKIISQINLRSKPTGSMAFDGSNITVGDDSGNVYLVNIRLMKTMWKAKTGGRIVGVLNWKNNSIVSSDDNFVYLLTSNSGKKVWKTRMAGRIIGITFLDDSTIAVLAQGTSTAIFLDLNTGKIVNRVNLEEDIYFVSPPLKIKDRLVLPTQKGLFVYSPNCK